MACKVNASVSTTLTKVARSPEIKESFKNV